jgi:hypothetical protein
MGLRSNFDRIRHAVAMRPANARLAIPFLDADTSNGYFE